MGLFSKIKEKVKAGLGAAKEEANHPGRPPSHRVDHNVFHREGSRDEAARVAKEAADPSRKKNAGEDKPWYLDGQNDGWDDVNVEQDPQPPKGGGAAGKPKG